MRARVAMDLGAEMRTLVMIVACVGCGAAQSTDTPTPLEAPEPAPQHLGGVAPEDVRVTGALPMLPLGLTSFGMAELNGDVYVLGGFFGTPHHYVPEYQSKTLYVLRSGASEWVALGELDAGLQSVALVHARSTLTRIGGMRVSADRQLRSVNEHAVYDDQAGTWTALPPLPEERSSHDAIAHGNDTWVLGGWKLDGHPRDARYAETALRFDGSEWQAVESPIRRRALGVAATRDHLVAVGGLTEDGISQEVDVLHVASGEWSRGPDLPGHATGFGVAVWGVGDVVYASGRDGAIYTWTVGAETWERFGSTVFPRFFHRMVQRGDALVVVGGIGGMRSPARTRIVESIPLEQSVPMLALDLPWAGQSRNRQGAFLLGDHLYFFGGNDSLGQHDFEREHFMREGWRVHLPSLEVERRSDYPVARQTMTTIAIEGTAPMGPHGPTTPSVVYSLAGFGHEGARPLTDDSEAKTQPQIYRYDPEQDTWTERASLPIPRSQIGAFEHEGALYVFGGLDYDATRAEGDQFRHLTELVRLGADAESFETMSAELPGPRRAFGGAFHQGRYYVVGGMKEGFQLVDDCVAFDVADTTFAEIACPARTRLNPRLVPVGNVLALVGGTTRMDDGELGEDRSVEVYDPEANSWRRLETEIPFTPKHAQAFAYNGRLLVVSTHNEEGRLRLAWIDVH